VADKKKPLGRKGIIGRFDRGDDTILNADSSAERRLLEAVLLVKGVATAARVVVGKDALELARLRGTASLPSFGKIAGAAFKLLPIDFPTGVKELISREVGGPQQKATTGGGQLNPAGSGVSVSIDIDIQLDDVLIAYLMAGYLIEKATPAAGPVAEGVVKGIASLAPTGG